MAATQVTVPRLPVSRTFPALLEEMAARFPDRNFVTDRNRRLSFSEFRAEARELAKGLHAVGVRKGDKVAILMGNQAEWLLVDFAVSMLGGVVVALNTWWRQSELHHALASSDATVLVMVDRYLSNDYAAAFRQMGDLNEALPKLRHIIGMGDDLLPGAMPFSDLHGYARDIDDGVLDVDVRPQDNAYLLFTSGSTARAKPVQLIHGHCIECPQWVGERMHLTEQDRVLLPTSMFWSFSCVNCLFAALTHGSSIVLLFAYDAGEMLRLIEAERCTVVYTLPNIVKALHAHPDRARCDLSSWRTGHCRQNVMPLLVEMGVDQMITGYGLTECYGNSANTDAHDPLPIRLRNSGRPHPNTELEIVDPATRRPLPQGAVGEIRLRGYVTPGYYNNPERTAEAIDADGWFYTGDLALLEEDGSLTFKSRLKEMIRTGGINVTPADVEDLLLSFQGVDQAIVVGIPDPTREEVVAAFVVPKPGAVLNVEALIEHCRRTAAVFKVPRLIEVVAAEEIPLTDTGKIHKGRIQERLSESYRTLLNQQKSA